MESARDLSNLSFAHEIIVNRNFHLEPDSLPQDRYISCIKKKKSVSISSHLDQFCSILVNLNQQTQFVR